MPDNFLPPGSWYENLRNFRQLLRRFAVERTQCVVCLRYYLPHEMVMLLRCGHYYHLECVSVWLSIHVRNPVLRAPCPYCGRALDIEHCLAVPRPAALVPSIQREYDYWAALDPALGTYELGWLPEEERFMEKLRLIVRDGALCPSCSQPFETNVGTAKLLRCGHILHCFVLDPICPSCFSKLEVVRTLIIPPPAPEPRIVTRRGSNVGGLDALLF